MSINKELAGDDNLDRSSWEGMGAPEISHETMMFVIAVQKKFLNNSNILDLEDAAIEVAIQLNDDGREAVVRALKEIGIMGIRGCLEKLLPNDELIKIDKEETKRLIDFIQYSGSTPG